MKILQWLNHGIFPGHTLLSCGFDYDEIVRLLKRKKADDWLSGLQHHEQKLRGNWNYFALYTEISHRKTKDEKRMFYILLRNKFDFTPDECAKLAHECLHICQFFLPDVLNRNKEIEAEAYFHTHLMRQCLEALKK